MTSSTVRPINVLLVTKTRGYRHDCIPSLISAFSSLPFTVKPTEDTTDILSLSNFDVVALGHNTDKFLTEEEADSLLSFVENGGGIVGIHAATSGMRANSKYTRILGEVFNGHPPPQWITLVVENPEHYINDHEPLPTTNSAPSSALPISINTESIPAKHFPWFDEVYTFKSHPCAATDRTILLSVKGDNRGDGSDGFPLSWLQTVGKGRVYYTALGHFDEAYQDPWFMENIRRAVVWTAKKEG
ncbi:Ff.00g129760.m01.CDS01 [Fusarium sp. VM40]|nr:Ff.00g129760.m01.CDS01 [Fusarium sp. VM40]